MAQENIMEDVAEVSDVKGLARVSERIWNYLSSQELWDFVMVASIKITAIIIVSYLVILIGKKLITRIFNLRMKTPINQSERRSRTIVKLLHSVLSYVVYFSAIIAILSALKIQVMGLLAGAGIAGLAIGFGAQSLVKDVITGFFIILEDQFGVGDYIRLNAAEGTVVEIGLRTTKIIGSTGEQYIIPNGLITDVINYSVNNSKAIIDMQVGIDADIEKVENLVTDYLKTLPERFEELINVPTFLGVQNVVGTEVTIRIIAETKPLQHYGIARVIRRDVKDLLDKNGIPMAYPKMMLYDRGSTESGGNEA
ncbi:small conductance mechanosensitive channel [Lysinibacillus composti]|uniref:Mechanosensitive ion channel family protein n=1 Tax=Lysinibacillus composti TaxID=720633 RepID=A0A3N9UC63_9BACI|nr:mechanosensitive ion channel family protein [Lysinibacillus composti]MBM7609493.1 small conductance mechanosensitive channel [Lysinibacillus composti]RQW74023.1 mechanosensitive ion channel family protein [Lysinibacillus composti]